MRTEGSIPTNGELFLIVTLFMIPILADDDVFYAKVPMIKVDKLRHDFLLLEELIWKNMLQNLFRKDKDTLELDLLKIYKVFGDKLEKDFPCDYYEIEGLENIWIWVRMIAELEGINKQYQSFRMFQKLQTEPEKNYLLKQAWLQVTHTMLNASFSIEKAEENIVKFIYDGNLMNKTLERMHESMLCRTTRIVKQSPQQVLLHMYESIGLTRLKSYVMMQFSYMLLTLYEEDNFQYEAHLARNRFKKTTTRIVELVKEKMENASREFWRCDPRNHVEGETYVEITNFAQGYVANEVDLNPNGSCTEDCSFYKYTQSFSCFEGAFCARHKPCGGKIYNCQYIDRKMAICPGNRTTGRRYEYVEYAGRTLGRKTICPTETIPAVSWRRWFWKCSYCFCICDEEDPYSERYFSLRPSVTDFENNRIVTGIRFTKNNKVIHLQVQEGTLLPRGEICNTTWLPVDDFRITDPEVYPGEDYHALTWQHRAIDLDDVFADEGYVLTGVRLQLTDTSHLSLEIHVSPFDFASGLLLEPVNASFWKSSYDGEDRPRKMLRIPYREASTKSWMPSLPDSDPNYHYIRFSTSDIDLDAAQTTLPFLDAQAVAQTRATPLVGAGLYHKGRKYYGGFVGPKIFTYDFGSHLQEAFPSSEKPIFEILREMEEGEILQEEENEEEESHCDDEMFDTCHRVGR